MIFSWFKCAFLLFSNVVPISYLVCCVSSLLLWDRNTRQKNKSFWLVSSESERGRYGMQRINNNNKNKNNNNCETAIVPRRQLEYSPAHIHHCSTTHPRCRFHKHYLLGVENCDLLYVHERRM